MLQKGTGAVSQYKLSRSLKTVTAQGFDCEQVRVSGYKIQQDLSEEQGSAKTVTSLLTLPSVLAFSDFIFVFLTKSVLVSWQNGVLSRCKQSSS